MTIARLAILGTHPVQYLAPIHRALAQRTDELAIKVFHTYSQSASGQLFDPGFGTAVRWDIPLLDGYEHEFVTNSAAQPSLERFGGIHTPQLIERVEQWRPDALLVYGWNYRSHLQALRHFKGRVPVLFRGDSTLLNPMPWWRRTARRALLGWVYRHVDMALAVGRNNADYFHWAGLAPEQIRIVPHSIDVRRFADPGGDFERQASEWRHSLGIDDTLPVVGFAGKLQPGKGTPDLIEAFAQLDAPAHLVFFGGGVLEQQLREQAAGLERVHFLPFQNQSRMPVVYRFCDLLTLPCDGPETWGLVLNEAMASGRAIFASTRAGATRDLVDEGVNGMSFRAGDVRHLRERLRELLAGGRTALREMGRNGLDASQAWGSESSAERIATVVREYLQ